MKLRFSETTGIDQVLVWIVHGFVLALVFSSLDGSGLYFGLFCTYVYGLASRFFTGLSSRPCSLISCYLSVLNDVVV